MASTYLTIPGVTNSSEDHWQSIWERQFPDKFRRIEQDEWDTPVCDDWIERIELEVEKHGPENVILVAHSLGCSAVAHWAAKFGTKIKGAFLVAPSDCEAETYTFDSKGFAPMSIEKLPFSSLVIASTNDQYITLERSEYFAAAWGSEFINVGEKGHINAISGFGEWDEGLELLKRLG